jgi:alpha-ketoglutarate-dependent taurine dioxygenase
MSLAAQKTQPEEIVVSDLKPRIGSEIKADTATLLSGVHAAEIRDLLQRRGVLVFREINLTDQQQVAFTRTLGKLVDEGVNNIYKITMDTNENPQADYLKGAFFWHIDGTTWNVPTFAAVLSAHRLAPSGGQTEYCNTYAAYDDLPESEKQVYDKLQVVHSFEVSQRYVNPEPSFESLQTWQKKGTKALPLVWKHRSGRKSLILGCTAAYVIGMNPEESTALLVRLRDYATQPKFVYRHEWKLGDMVIWDNTGTMHRAMPYALDSGRMMHRSVLQGEEPVT